MTSLQSVDLSHNRISYLPSLAFGTLDGVGTQLYQLNLAGNQLTTIDNGGAFLYMTAVAYLDLSYNRLATFVAGAFERLTNLETLLLNNNRLHRFPADALRGQHRLRVLRLDNNDIVGLPPHALLDMVGLHMLTLAHNRLISIAGGVLPPTVLTQLRTLDLSANNIQYLSTMAFANLSALQVLDLS
jgi:Leucine-rich repeat (LRR) protein